ncbi:MAG: hypothetical protein Kow0062_11680 [Acidobacteriota bacterium]
MTGPSDRSNRRGDEEGGGTAVLDAPRPETASPARQAPAGRPDEPRRAAVDPVPERRVDPWATTTERPAVEAPPQTALALRLLVAAALTTACLVVTVMNVTGTGPFRRTAIGSVIDAADARVERDLAFAVEEIEAYRHEHGALPGDLTPFDFGREPGWHYERIDPTAFRLVLEAGPMRVSWDSRRTEERDGMDAAR